MLLHARLANPKAPRRRSRAGCSYCRNKQRKKCDEARPKCSRCVRHQQICVYEPANKKDSVDGCSPRVTRKTHSANSNRTSPVQTEQLQEDLNLVEQHEKHQERVQLRHGVISQRHSRHDAFIPAESIDHVSYSSSALTCGSTLAWGEQTAFSAAGSGSSFDFTSIGGLPFEDKVDEMTRCDDDTPSRRVGRSSSSLDPMSSLQTPSPLFEFCPPAFTEFSQQTNRRVLMDHFCNVLSHLIVLREETGNPFQQLVLPLSYNSQAVTGAIFALASAHLECRGVQNSERSVYFHDQAIRGLARLIEQGENIDNNELLAAIMLLVYYEVLVQKGRSNTVNIHLKGAIAIMNNRSPRTDSTSIFLERAFRFYDVIAALSFGTAPHSTAPTYGCLAPFPAFDWRLATSTLGSVDSLLGMATSLWPIIHRLSGMQEVRDALNEAVSCGKVSKAAVLRSEFEATTSAIETALQSWKPTLPPNSMLSKDPADLSPDNATEGRQLQSIINSALAYRSSALVYLYRTIYNYPHGDALVQRHVHVSLTYCAETVGNEGPMGTLLWPLFIAACEATNFGDRDLARRSFEGIGRRQGMTNIERAWHIVQEVWRRADRGEVLSLDEEDTDAIPCVYKGDLWRRVTGEMGVTIVFG